MNENGAPFLGLPHIPAMRRLMERPAWVTWKHVWDEEKGRWTKPPVNVHTGRIDNGLTPSSQGTYEAALARVQRDRLPGLGFVMSEGDGLTALDLDKCRDPQTGALNPLAAEVVALGETYCERSPSGSGLRLFAEGKIAANIQRSDIGIEAFGRAQYVTVTGAHVNGTPLEIRPAPKTLALLSKRAGASENTDQGGAAPPKGKSGNAGKTDESFWRNVNRDALDRLDVWVPTLFPQAQRTTKGWRVTSRALGRGLEEDLSFTRNGIKDFGLRDQGDAVGGKEREGRRSPIMIVMEHMAITSTEAAQWLCRQIGVDPASLGWIDRTKPGADRPIEPTYPSREQPVAEARQAAEQAIQRFLKAADSWNAEPNPFKALARESLGEPPPPVHALRIATGVGKTSIAATLIAERLKAAHGRPVLYAVPTRWLGDAIVKDFDRHGVVAKLFRGRRAPDPDRNGKTMCGDLDAVQVALDLGATVSTTCCKGKHPGTKAAVQCSFYESCSYQRQKASTPQVWIVAHEMLFLAQAALGKVACVFVDEGFWQTGIWKKPGLTLDEIKNVPDAPHASFAAMFPRPHRNKLARALRRQTEDGGVKRQHLVDEELTAEICTEAIAAEWKLKGKTELWPGMPRAARKAAAKAARGAKHVRAIVNVWRAARDLLDQDDAGAVSGRLVLDTTDVDEGAVRVVRTRGIKAVVEQWRAPTLLMDATLPEKAILRAYYPQVEMTADIDVAMPHVTVRQILGAPVAKKKLFNGGEAERNLKLLRRTILRRWIETGRQPTLVVCQKAVETWLKAAGLPSTISVEHFNNVSGLDQYRDVRLLITIGRTQPDPAAHEADAGALTGIEPLKAGLKPNGSRWFDKVLRGIRMADGSGRAVICDQHPDPIAEACRRQVCEGELVQAIGRGRGVNRTSASPLDIDIIADVVLPVTVNTVTTWEATMKDTGGWWEMAALGVVLTSPTDMAAALPEIWPNLKAAQRDPPPPEVKDISLARVFSQGFCPSPPPPLVCNFLPASRRRAARPERSLRHLDGPRSARLAGGAPWLSGGVRGGAAAPA